VGVPSVRPRLICIVCSIRSHLRPAIPRERFRAVVPNLSAWRRVTVGDLTSAFHFTRPEQSIPTLPSTLPAIPQILVECAASLAGTTPYQVPNPQSSPTQETGTATRPSGPC